MRRRLTLLSITLCLSGCAGLRTLSSEVTAYGNWPAQRSAGPYVFDRLPSQQARLDQQQALESAAKPALEGAGFKWVNDRKQAQYLIELQARSSANERSRPDAFWAWQSVPSPHTNDPGRPRLPGLVNHPTLWFHPLDIPSYEHEAVVLVRDAQSGQTLFESHAVSDARSPSLKGMLVALFKAALKDFPHAGSGPRHVTIPLTQ